MGFVLIIIGLVAIVFGKVMHITDSTAKAVGWIVLNWVLRVIGVFLILAGIANIIGI